MDEIRDLRNSKYGFLSVMDIPRLGYCGGLLVLSSSGRPIEFHCTAPVTANRAQQILYGETLKQFLICDQIGIALIGKAKSKLNVVLVDDRELLALTESVQLPFVFVSQIGPQIDSLQSESSADTNVLEVSGHRFETQGSDQYLISELLESFLETLPATEPFERIHQAISEAHLEAA